MDFQYGLLICNSAHSGLIWLEIFQQPHYKQFGKISTGKHASVYTIISFNRVVYATLRLPANRQKARTYQGHSVFVSARQRTPVTVDRFTCATFIVCKTVAYKNADARATSIFSSKTSPPSFSRVGWFVQRSRHDEVQLVCVIAVRRVACVLATTQPNCGVFVWDKA